MTMVIGTANAGERWVRELQGTPVPSTSPSDGVLYAELGSTTVTQDATG